MSMLKSRLLPLAGVAGLGALLWSQTSGGAQAVKSHSAKPADQQYPVSETLTAIGNQGGKHTTDRGPGPEQFDPQDTRMMSRSPDALSKKNPGKARDMDRDNLGPVNPGPDGKNIGDRSSDLPWKRREQGEGGKGA